MKTGDIKMASTLLMLMGEETASNILKHLNESEIEEITKQISSSEITTPQETEKSAEELYRLIFAGPQVPEAGSDYAKRVVMRALEPGPAKRIIDRLSSSHLGSNAFQAVDRMNPKQLAQYLQNEHPQTIAVIMAHVTPTSAAALLRSLPEEIQADVSVRMANLQSVSPDVVRSIFSVLEEKLKPAPSSPSAPAPGGARAVAELFNRLGRKASHDVLERISSATPELADSIKQLMFIFEDIAMLEDSAIREILQRVDKKTISQALKGATDGLQQQFFRNMSQRAVEMMNEEMEIMGPIKAKEIQAAQQKVVETVRKLEEEGIVKLGDGEEDES